MKRPEQSITSWQGQIERIAWGGKGIGRLDDGRVVLLESPLALFSGEIVLADIVVKKKHAEGMVTDWITKDPRRGDPKCPYALDCGGCSQLGCGSHQGELKRLMVDDLFHRGLDDHPVFDLLSPETDTFRHRIQLHWDMDKLGYHRKRTNEIVEISSCIAAHPAVSRAIPYLTSALISCLLPSEPARWELSTGTPGGNVWATCSKFPGMSWRLEGELFQQAEGDIIHQLDERVLHQRPGGFFQVSPSWAWQAFKQILFNWDIKGETLFDLYGGCGFFSRMLSHRFKKYILVESAPMSLATAPLNLDGMPVEIVKDRVENWIKPGISRSRDVILLDPPRSGLDPQVVLRLRESEASGIILIGCDGASFCRDTMRLSLTDGAAAGRAWKLSKISVIDLFPNTSMVECVGLFER